MSNNPPPGRPVPPPRWTPPPGQAPDPDWPPLPPGQRLLLAEVIASHDPDDSGGEGERTRPWYSGTWAVVGALVLFLPLGLVLMWRRTDWTRARRGWVTAGATATGLVVAGAMISSPLPSSPVGQATTAPAGTAASPAAPIATTHQAPQTDAEASRSSSAQPHTAPSATPRTTPHPARRHGRPTAHSCDVPYNPYGLNRGVAGRHGHDASRDHRCTRDDQTDHERHH